MQTLKELKTKLKKHKLATSGNKSELQDRLSEFVTKKVASVPIKTRIRQNVTFETQKKFYLSLLIQKPNSEMAQKWYKNAGISTKEFSDYKKDFLNRK